MSDDDPGIWSFPFFFLSPAGLFKAKPLHAMSGPFLSLASPAISSLSSPGAKSPKIPRSPLLLGTMLPQTSEDYINLEHHYGAHK
jgi:hypothetical protein